MDGQEIMEAGKGEIIKSLDRSKIKTMHKYPEFLELENTFKISKTLFTELGMETVSKTSPDKNMDISPSIRHLLLKIENANSKVSTFEFL